jgi:hypothetical protein
LCLRLLFITDTRRVVDDDEKVGSRRRRKPTAKASVNENRSLLVSFVSFLTSQFVLRFVSISKSRRAKQSKLEDQSTGNDCANPV